MAVEGVVRAKGKEKKKLQKGNGYDELQDWVQHTHTHTDMMCLLQHTLPSMKLPVWVLWRPLWPAVSHGWCQRCPVLPARYGLSQPNQPNRDDTAATIVITRKLKAGLDARNLTLGPAATALIGATHGLLNRGL